MKAYTLLFLSVFIMASNAWNWSKHLINYVDSIDNELTVTACKKDSLELNQCIINMWEYLSPLVAKGVPRFNVPSLKPLALPDLKIDKKGAFLHYKAIWSPFYVSGTEKAKITKLNLNPKDFSLALSLEIPELDVNATYDMDTIVMKIAPVNGKGEYKGKIVDIKLDAIAKAKLVPAKNSNKSYMQVSDLKLRIYIGDALGFLKDTTYSLQSKLATKTANTFFDKHRRRVLNMLTPSIEDYSKTVVMDIVNKILASTPYEDMSLIV